MGILEARPRLFDGDFGEVLGDLWEVLGWGSLGMKNSRLLLALKTPGVEGKKKKIKSVNRDFCKKKIKNQSTLKPVDQWSIKIKLKKIKMMSKTPIKPN